MPGFDRFPVVRAKEFQKGYFSRGRGGEKASSNHSNNNNKNTRDPGREAQDRDTGETERTGAADVICAPTRARKIKRRRYRPVYTRVYRYRGVRRKKKKNYYTPHSV